MAPGIVDALEFTCEVILELPMDVYETLRERIVQTFCGVHEIIYHDPGFHLLYGTRSLIPIEDYLRRGKEVFVFKDSVDHMR